MKKLIRSRSAAQVCKALSIVLFLAIWEILVRLNVLTPLMFGNLPAPTRVLEQLSETLADKEYYLHIGYSCVRVLIGCVIAVILGVFFGIAIALNWFFEYFFRPIFELLRPIPQITWIPISILLFPTIEGSIRFITFLGAFFPILVNTIAGVRSISPNLIAAAVSMHANHRQLIWHVYLPGALPHIFPGLSVGMGTSWMSVIAAEMISGKYGIGYFTWTSYNLMEYENTIIGMFTIGVLGLLSFVLLNLIERKVLRYQETEVRR